MKMTKIEKRVRKMNIATLREKGGMLFNDGNTTFAWLPVFPGADTGWLGIAICHPNDKFSRKYGEHIAMMQSGQENTIMRRETVEGIWDYSGDTARIL